MKVRLNLYRPAFLTDPSTLWGLHSFAGDYVEAGPGHYRTGSYTGDGTGAPVAMCKYNSLLVRALNGKIYVANTEIGTYTGDVTFASLGGLLIWSNGTGNLQAYDSANPTWLAETLGVSKPANTFTVTAGGAGTGSMDAGDYWYRITYVDAWGHEGQPSDAKQVTSVPATGSVSIASIPPYTDSKATYIRIYRTYVDGTEDTYDSDYHLVAEVAAATTSYSDTKADIELTDDLLYGLEWGSTFRSIPAGTNLCVWGQRLAWSSGNMVYVSDYSETGAPRPGETYAGYKVGDDSNITALQVLDGRLMIFKATPAIYVMAESDIVPFTIKEYSTSYGAVNREHVVPWLGGLALYWGKRVYAIPGFKDLTELVQPLFGCLTSITSTWLAVDDLDRLYVCAYGGGPSYPVFGSNTDGYVAYIYSHGTYGWTRTMNFDLRVMYADRAAGTTYGLDKNGWLEKIDWTTIREKSTTAIASTAFTVDSSTKITFTDSSVTTALKVGDYVVYWDPSAYRASVSRITTIHSSTSLSVADGIFSSVSGDVGLVSIGKVFVAKSAATFSDNGDNLQGEHFSALLYTSDTANLLGFKYDTQGYPVAISSILRDNDYLWQRGDIKSHWRLTPYLEGAVSSNLRFDVEHLSIRPSGKAGRK